MSTRLPIKASPRTSAPLALLIVLSHSLPTPAHPPIHPLLLAQSPQKTIQITGSLVNLTKALAQKAEAQSPDLAVEVSASDTAAALKSLIAGKADLAAIGRPLTDDEKAAGLIAEPVTRHKIALIVGKDNAFSGSLTDVQFAKIFRGEITNWSEVGGADGKIRFIDHSTTSDTRQALRDYPVFQSAPFKATSNAVKLAADSDNSPQPLAQALVTVLGKNGISYAIVDQVLDNPALKILPMNKTLPTDRRYPFSQPLFYVHKRAINPEIKAFLATVSDPNNQQLIEKARVADAVDSAVSETSLDAGPNASSAARILDAKAQANSSTAQPAAAVPWWPWLVSIPVLGGLLWWLLSRSQSSSQSVSTGVQPVVSTVVLSQANGSDSRAIAKRRITKSQAIPHGARLAAKQDPVPDVAMPENRRLEFTEPAEQSSDLPTLDSEPQDCDCRAILVPHPVSGAYAYWEVSPEHHDALRQRDGQKLMLRIHDVTGIDIDYEPPHDTQEYICDDEPDMHVNIPAGNRDYLAELGYVTGDQCWLRLARSAPVRITE